MQQFQVNFKIIPSPNHNRPEIFLYLNMIFGLNSPETNLNRYYNIKKKDLMQK